MEIVTFKELLERELEKIFYDLTKRRVPLDTLDFDLMAWFDYFFSKKLPGLLHNSIISTFSKDPSIVDIFLSESNKSMISKYEGDAKNTLQQRLYSALFFTRIPSRAIKPVEEDVFNYLLPSLNSNLEGLILIFRKIEADYQAGTLVITPVETGESKSSNVDDNSPNSKKMKVNLSVVELATLLRLIVEIEPRIFQYKDKTELFRFVANNFITVGTEDPTTKSLSSKFYNFDSKSLYKWERYFSEAQVIAKKIREK